MKIHRSRLDGGFTQVPNEAARDDRLSYHARGLLTELLSRPDGWDENADAITARGRAARGAAAEGRRATRAAMAELVAAGYVHRLKMRGPRGRWATEMHVCDQPTDVPDGGTSVRPAQTHVSAGGSEVPPTGTPVSGTSNRTRSTEHGENTKSTLRPSSADAADAARPNHKQDPQRRTAEWLITAYLGECFGGTGEPEVIRWQQRTFRSHMHADEAAYCRYLLRCYHAARDRMDELAVLKSDDGGYFADDAGPLLRELRAVVKRHRLSRADEAACEAIAAWAVDAAEPLLDPYSGDWCYLTVHEATEAGVAEVWRDRANMLPPSRGHDRQPERRRP